MSSNVAKMPTSSFVTQVLASAGRLDKEDLSVKLSQLSRKTSEMKVEVFNALHKNYAEFYPNFDAIRVLSTRVNEFQKEMETQISAIENQMKAHMELSAAGNNDLFSSLSETLSVMSLLGQLVKVHDGFQLVRKDLISKSYVRAASQLVTIEHILTELNSTYGDSLKILRHLLARQLTLKEELMWSLTTVWSESFQWKVEKDKGVGVKKETTVQLILSISREAKDRLSAVINAMNDLGMLSTSLKSFADNLSKHLLRPMITTAGVRVTLSSDPATTTITITTPVTKNAKPTRPDAVDALNTLDAALGFLKDCLIEYTISVPAQSDVANTKQESTNLIALLGKRLSDELVESLISELLARSVPSNHRDLKSYGNVVMTTVKFQTNLIAIGFLDSKNTKLMDYVNNIDLVFAKKKCQGILERARELMRSPLHNTVSVSSVDCKLENAELGLAGSEKAKAKSAEKMAELVDSQLSPPFRFPSCKISACAHELVEMAYQMLQEAVTSLKGSSPPEGASVTPVGADKQCAIQLFYGVRNMLELYCIVVPVYHKELLQTVPLVSAVHHNDCMYVAHHLPLLGHQYRPLLPEPLCHGAATFIDLVPVFRRLGAKNFTDHLAQQKREILDCLSVAHGFVNIGEGDNYRDADRAVNQLTLKLRHLAKVWRDVLPSAVYNKTTGALLNCAVAEVLDRVCSIEDISEQDAKQLSSIFGTITTAGRELIASDQPTSVYKFVPKWNKMEEMKLLLTARLQEIVDRWADGKGPLASEFTAAELKRLIRALFQNTEKRAAALASISDL